MAITKDSVLTALEEHRRANSAPRHEEEAIAAALARAGVDPREQNAIAIADAARHTLSIAATHARHASMAQWIKELNATVEQLRSAVEPPREPINNPGRADVLVWNSEVVASIIRNAETVQASARAYDEFMKWRHPSRANMAYQAALDIVEHSSETLFPRTSERWTNAAIAAVLCYWRLAGVASDEDGAGGFDSVIENIKKLRQRRRAAAPQRARQSAPLTAPPSLGSDEEIEVPHLRTMPLTGGEFALVRGDHEIIACVYEQNLADFYSNARHYIDYLKAERRRLDEQIATQRKELVDRERQLEAKLAELHRQRGDVPPAK